MLLHTRIGRLRNPGGVLRTLRITDLELFSTALRITRSFLFQYAFGVLHSDRVGATSASHWVLHMDNGMTYVPLMEQDDTRAESRLEVFDTHCDQR